MPRDPEAVKAARRRHYERNKQAYVDRARAQKAALAQEVRDIKAASPCSDCGKWYPHYVMDFDHLPGTEKVGDIATLIQRSSRKKVLEEIAKCELVCANCHRERTWLRAQVAVP